MFVCNIKGKTTTTNVVHTEQVWCVSCDKALLEK